MSDVSESDHLKTDRPSICDANHAVGSISRALVTLKTGAENEIKSTCTTVQKFYAICNSAIYLKWTVVLAVGRELW